MTSVPNSNSRLRATSAAPWFFAIAAAVVWLVTLGGLRSGTASAAMLLVLLVGLLVFIEAGVASFLAATPNQPAVAIHTRLNRAPPQGIPTCAGRSWGCNY
jgi:hypothetical protein